MGELHCGPSRVICRSSPALLRVLVLLDLDVKRMTAHTMVRLFFC